MSWSGVFLTFLLVLIVMSTTLSIILSMHEEERDRIIQTTVENEFTEELYITEQPIVPNFKIGLMSESVTDFKKLLEIVGEDFFNDE
jgi:hypothetical protein